MTSVSAHYSVKLWHGVKFLSFVFRVSRPFRLSPQHFNAQEGFLSEHGLELKFKLHFLFGLREILKTLSISALGAVPCLSDRTHFFLRSGGLRGRLCLRNMGFKQVARVLCWSSPLDRIPGGPCSPGPRASRMPVVPFLRSIFGAWGAEKHTLGKAIPPLFGFRKRVPRFCSCRAVV